jgi:phosphatidate phosphatase LPIN
MRKPEIFKMACLRDIQRLFGNGAKTAFYAGFGNRITDAMSYRSVNVPSSRIFTIDSGGEVKMELLELAGYKSSCVSSRSPFEKSLTDPHVCAFDRYIHMVS